MKRLICIAITFLMVGFLTTEAGRSKRGSYRLKTIVIDAGHGGHDSGCLGSSSKEKEVALNIALKLGKLIEQNYPDVKVIYTRKTDVFIPLHERANIANRAKADLFICIHLNSGAKSAYGAETYVMGLHKSNDNLGVAKRENAAILLEDDYKTQYDGFDPNSPEANIIFSLYQNQFMHQSLEFASKVQQQFEDYAGRNNRGVKQAGFLVLYKTAMPAVLIENGFLTNEVDEHYLDSDKGQSTMATAIYRAFKEYKLDLESGAVEPVLIEKKEDSDVKIDSTPAVKNDKPIVVENPIVRQEIKSPPPIDSIPKSVPSPKSEIKVPTTNTVLDAFIGVQIGASSNPDTDLKKYAKVKDLKQFKGSDGLTRFVVGSYKTIQEAKKRQVQLKAEGYNDCFLTGYKNDKKVTPAEVEQFLKKN